MDSYKDHPLYRIHNIDSAMDVLWQFYKTRFFSLFAISIVISGILQSSTLFFDLKDLQQINDPMQLLEKAKGMILPISVMMIVSLLFSTIFSYYILHKPLDPGINIFVCAVSALKYFIPYLIIIIILAFAGSIALVFGLLLLVVGMIFAAVYIAMISLFILPVMMNERMDIGRTISRTIILSHRGFWTNMGWTAVFLILIIVLSIVLSGLVMIPFAGSFFKIFSNPDDVAAAVTFTSNPLFQILSVITNAIIFPLMPVFSFILYFNGKAREDALASKTEADQGDTRVRVEDLYSSPRDENGELQ